MGAKIKESSYDFYDAGYQLHRLEEMTLPELKTVGKTLGMAVAKYNTRDQLINDLYLQINGMRMNEHVPDRPKRYTRVTDVPMSNSARYDLISYDGKGAILGGIACQGILHLSHRDGYLCADAIPGSNDVLILDTYIKKYRLKEGDYIVGRYMYAPRADVLSLTDVISVNGKPPLSPLEAIPASMVPTVKLPFADSFDPMLKSIGVICPPHLGESLLISHPYRYHSPELMIEAINCFAKSVPDGEKIALFIMPNPSMYKAIEAAGGTVIGSDVPLDFVQESVSVAIKRARWLASQGKQVLLAVFNMHYLLQSRNNESALQLLSSPVAYGTGGTLTVFASFNVAAADSERLGLLRGFADNELAIGCDDRGYLPDFALSGSARDNGESVLELRRQAAEKGDRAVYESTFRRS